MARRKIPSVTSDGKGFQVSLTPLEYNLLKLLTKDLPDLFSDSQMEIGIPTDEAGKLFKEEVERAHWGDQYEHWLEDLKEDEDDQPEDVNPPGFVSGAAVWSYLAKKLGL